VYEEAREIEASVISETGGDFVASELIYELEDQMEVAAKNLEFERAALLRDQIAELKNRGDFKEAKPVSYKSSSKKKGKSKKVTETSHDESQELDV
jgi:excinuclease ABC subunit B